MRVKNVRLVRSPTDFPSPLPPRLAILLIPSLVSPALPPLFQPPLPGLQKAACGMGVSQAVGNGKPQQFSESSSPQEPRPVTRRGRRPMQLTKSECGPTLGVGTRAFLRSCPLSCPSRAVTEGCVAIRKLLCQRSSREAQPLPEEDSEGQLPDTTRPPKSHCT